MSDLAFDLGGDLGGSITMPKAVVTVDHIAGGLSRLLTQFKSSQPIDNPAGRTDIEKFTAILLKPFQELEEVNQQLIQLRDVFTAVGDGLNKIGKLVGQDRGQFADNDYRRLLFARIATNFSDGRRETLINIVKLILNASGSKVVINNRGPAAAIVRIDNYAVTDSLASIILGLLHQAIGAGINISLQSSPQPISDQFAFPVATFANIGIASGVSTIFAMSTAGFPATGTLDIDVGTSLHETIGYHATTPTSFAMNGPTAHSHETFCAVQLVDPTTGKGFGDIADVGQPDLTPYSNDSTIGGTLIDERT